MGCCESRQIAYVKQADLKTYANSESVSCVKFGLQQAHIEKKTDLKTYANSESEHNLIIVIGYIRECETLNMRIPAEIRKLCYLFYAYCRKKIFLSPPRIFYKPQKQSFGIYDITSKKMSVATAHENDTKYFDDFVIFHDTFCYIPQINCLEKKYDAILTQFTMKTERNRTINQRKNYLGLILFESDDIDNEMIKYNVLVDVKKIEDYSVHNKFVRQFLYCGPKHGIIYEEEQGQLFQLQKNKISSFDFNPIRNCNTNIFSSKDVYGNRWLNMCYISNLEQIFAISCGEDYRDGIGSTYPGMLYSVCSSEAKCGIYDFKNNMWKQIESIKFNALSHIKDYFRCVSCSDKCGENIYVLPDKAQCGLNMIQYDMHQNRWMEVDHGRSTILSTYYSSIWIDDDNPQILYYSDARFGFKVMKFDLRNKDEKWMDVVKLDGHSDWGVSFV